MSRQKKKLTKNNSIETYNIWKQYNDFIRSLYLETPFKRTTGKEKTWRFLTKLLIVFCGAFFTTLTFYFLIDPNGIYNSGLNGILQVFSRLLVGHGKVSAANYYFLYYGLGLLTNLLFILALRFFFKAKLEIISTSIFYVLSQIIWTQIFHALSLRQFLFNRFNPGTWQNLTSQSQLSFTLPYYIVIAIVAAVIHTYGYSLIFQAQATPGGLEIITSHFSTQKRTRFSISKFTKIFGFVIIFLVSLANFIWVENNPKMKKSELEKEIREKKIIKDNENFDLVWKRWENHMKEIHSLSIKNNATPEEIKKIVELRKKNFPLTSLFRNKTGGIDLEKYPQEVEYYLVSEEEKGDKIKKEVREIEKGINDLSGTELKRELQRKSDLEFREKNLTKERNHSKIFQYLSYISNNERLWATLVYIFFSSFLISQIFPRNQVKLLRLHSRTHEARNQGLKLLENYSPVYYNVYRRRGEEEEVVYVINCYISKWNYYLLSPHLKQLGTIHI